MTVAPEETRLPNEAGGEPDRSGSRRRLVMWVSLALAALLAGFVAVLASSGPASQSQSGSPLIGQPAPSVQGPDGAGHTVTLASMRGRWVLVNFAASWCAPCQAETPQLLAFAARHQAPNGPTIITVEYQESDLTSLRRFLAIRHATWPVVDDSEAFVRYGSFGLPESYLVNPSGLVVAKVTGGVVADDLDKLIDSYSASAGSGS